MDVHSNRNKAPVRWATVHGNAQKSVGVGDKIGAEPSKLVFSNHLQLMWESKSPLAP
jgi:hypothetical protein